MQELNEMLADLAGDGALDSSGVFTVSLGKAEEKLAAYRLTNPGLFVLNLLAAAVSAGASKFSVENYEQQTIFAFDPKVEYQHSDLEDLFSFILKPSAPAHLRELALALHGARDLPESPTISLKCGGSQPRELVVQGRDLSLRPSPDSRAGIQLTLTFPRSGMWSMLFSPQNERAQEILQHLYHFCRFAPLKLTSDGQLKSTPVSLGGPEVFAWREVRGEQPLIMAEPEGHFPRSDTAPPSLRSTLLIGLSTMKTANATGLLLVSRGVTFKRPQSLLGFPMACAVVSADHLEKNLSQSDLVEDSEYQTLLKAVRDEVQLLVLDVCRRPPHWSAGQKAGFARALNTLYPPESPAPNVVEAFRRNATVEESCREPESQAKQMDYWRALQKEDPERAKDFGAYLAEAVKRQATRRLNNGDWKAALPYLEDLRELRSEAPNALLGVVCLLADETRKGTAILTSGCAGNTAALSSLVAMSPLLDGDALDQFLAFEKLFEENQLQRADELRDTLLEREGTAVLFLWMGWYDIFRGRHGQALRIWEKALQRVTVDERERWAAILWPALSGKVSFLDQVGWQARRAMESFQFTTNSAPRERSLQNRASHPARWAKQVWEARLRGARDEARQLFLKGYLSAILDLETLSLEPLDSPRVVLAPFHRKSAAR